MSGVHAFISNKTFEITRFIKKKKADKEKECVFTKYLFIFIDKIHKMRAYAKDYEFYSMYCSSPLKTLAQEIENNNQDVLHFIPNNLVLFIREMISIFKDFKLPHGYDDLYDLNRVLQFNIVSKELLMEDYMWKRHLPFTNLRMIIDSDDKIKILFKDITNIAFKREYEMNIVMPASFYSMMDARILTAYTVAEVELP